MSTVRMPSTALSVSGRLAILSRRQQPKQWNTIRCFTAVSSWQSQQHQQLQQQQHQQQRSFGQSILGNHRSNDNTNNTNNNNSNGLCRRFLSSGTDNGLPVGLQHLATQNQPSSSSSSSLSLPSASSPGGTLGGDTITVETKPPEKLDQNMLEIINNVLELYIQHGVTRERLLQLSKDTNNNLSLVQHWQKMMEIYFTAQLTILVPLGYQPDERGLQQYAYQLQQYTMELEKDQSKRQVEMHFRNTRKIIWRLVVSTAFDLNLSNLPEMELVTARNHMHAVATRMSSPEILMQIQKSVSRISVPDHQEQEAMLKQTALQEIIIHQVYLGNESQLLVDMGFPPGPKGYATFQCVIADFENDPLINEYQTAAMKKVWQAAGIDLSQVMGDGNTPRV